MAKKHKGGKHEKARKTASAPAPRPPVKATKRARPAQSRPAKPRPAEPELIVVLEPECEPQAEGFPFVEEVIVEPAPFDPVPYRPMRHRSEPISSSDWEMDFAYQCAEEQVALAMLEAEQAVALCQGYHHLDPYPLLDASPFDATSSLPPQGSRTLPALASQPRSMYSMESESEDEPFAFDHI